jgi:trimeric autotransporter adhesin
MFLYVTARVIGEIMRLFKQFAIALTPFILQADGAPPLPAPSHYLTPMQVPEMPLILNVELPPPPTVHETPVVIMQESVPTPEKAPVVVKTEPVVPSQHIPIVIKIELSSNPSEHNNPTMTKVEIVTPGQEIPVDVKVEVVPTDTGPAPVMMKAEAPPVVETRPEPLMMKAEAPPVVETRPEPLMMKAEALPLAIKANPEPVMLKAEAARSSDDNQMESEEAVCLSSFHVVHADVRHTEANGVGYKDGYTTLEGFGICDGDSAFMPFLDLRGHIFNDGKLAGNIGIGERTYIPSISHLFGAYFYYDVRQGERGLTAMQLSPGFELLGKRMEYRINGYFPIGNTKSHRYDDRFDKFSGHNIFMKYNRKYAMAGFDGELGAHLTQSTKNDVYFGVGPYYFTAESMSAWGGKGRLLWRYKDYVSLEASYSYDHLFKNVIQGTLSLIYPFGSKLQRTGKNCPNGNDLALSKAAFAPYRFEIPVVKKKTTRHKAVNPATNTPFNVWFVNNESHSAGTFESPFPTLAQAENASGPNDMIYVFSGDGTTTGMNQGITLQNGQFLFGSGVAHPLKTTQGKIVIPPFSPNLPRITNSGSIVTLANSNEVSGFNLFATQAGATTINGTAGITSANINQNTFSGNVAYTGIFINGQGTFSITNNNFLGGATGEAMQVETLNTDFAAIYILDNNIVGFANSMIITPVANPSTASNYIVIAGNQCSNFTGNGISYTTGGPGTIARILNNTLLNTMGTGATVGIFVDLNDTSGAGTAVISNNSVITTTPTVNSIGIQAKVDLPGAQARMIITDNTVVNGTSAGSVGFSSSVVGSSSICATITGNHIQTTGALLGMNISATGLLNIDDFSNNTVNLPNVSITGNVNFAPLGSCGQ